MLVDVLKAPHHGGRIYLESADSANDLYRFLQPSCVLRRIRQLPLVRGVNEAVIFPPADEEVVSLDENHGRERFNCRPRLFEQAAASLLGVEANFDDVSALRSHPELMTQTNGTTLKPPNDAKLKPALRTLLPR